MYAGKLQTSSNIAWHRPPQSIIFREEEELMQNSVRALADAIDPLEKLRLLCLSRGSAGIMWFCRILRHMDNDGSKQLTKDQFIKGIEENNLGLHKEDAEELFNRFDNDKSGSINLNDFLTHLRPAMSESRCQIVEQVFRKLHKNVDNVVHIDDIKREYAVTCNPRYLNGDETGEVIMHKFLANFETEGTVNGTVTLDEFMDFYSGVSGAIDSDCFFDLMMRQAFKL